MTALAAEGPSLISCNLPPRQSVSELEPPRMSYYNENKDLSVPFKWEAAPGTPIVDHSSQAGVGDHQDSGRLLLRPPPSALNFPLNSFVPAILPDELKSDLPPKSTSRSRPEFKFSMSTRSSSTTTTAASTSDHRRARRKGSTGRLSDFDWPEESDEEYSSPSRTDAQEPAASALSTTMAKQWSFSSASHSSASQTPSPLSSDDDGGARTWESYKRDLLALSNRINFSAATAVEPASSDGSSESTEGSEYGESDSSETDDHVHHLGLFSCMPIFSRIWMIQWTFGASDKRKFVIKFSKRVTPGRRNKGYRPNHRLSL